MAVPFLAFGAKLFQSVPDMTLFLERAGGYPVIGCVATYHLDRAGQIPVQAWVRFNPLGDFAPACDTASPDC